MAIKIKFDLTGNPDPPTIILANKNGNKLGQLKVNADSIELVDKLNDASEISFTINKYIDEKLTPLWGQVVDFKLVYCKEWDCWFEIKVELDEETETVKTVFGTQLGQAELSQIMLYDIEINTEKDIERDDYKISILYDQNNPDASILNRILNDKAPHYSIAYVSPTISKIQRSFSFNDISILDAFQKISEEIGCLFQYYASKGEDGILHRKIAVYDLQQYCNDCGHRSEYVNKCSKCNSTNLTNGYGDDTLIFVTSDELASNGIQLVTDTDSVKNCFKLEAGDDLTTATIRNCNPNGTDYIWYFSDSLKEDMSENLVLKLNSYDELYNQYCNEYTFNVRQKLIDNYNSLITKYSENISIKTPIVGYYALMNAYYNTVDMALKLESSLMPSIELSDTNATKQANLITSSSISPVAVSDITVASLATVDSAVLAMAKTIIRSNYRVQINTSEMSDDGNTRIWRGNFVVTNYSDEEDTAVSNTISVNINDDLETFVKQKIEKALNKENTDDLSISGVFSKEYNEFCKALKEYALNPLISFHDACQACIDILIEQGIGNDVLSSDENGEDDGNNEESEVDLYEKLYVPYYDKLVAIESEIKIREEEINIIYELQEDIDKCRIEIQDALNFEDYLGNELWLEFCTYRREDKYLNENYISDGLDNAELFEKALEFIDVAKNEIYKSAELQHSISANLNNLLAIEKFKPLVDSFENGNWIRVQINDDIFKLRLIEYTINFDSFNDIPVKFSDVTKVRDGITDVESILSQASSMTTSYDSIKRQSEQGNKANEVINNWLETGLNSALVRIQNNNNEDIVFDKNGLLCRSYDDITDTYSPEQFKLTHNVMAYTTDNWKTVSAALGKHEYNYYDSDKLLQRDVGYGLSAKFVTAGYVSGSQIIGGEVISSNYVKDTSGTYLNLIDGDFELAGGKIVYNVEDNSLNLKDVIIAWDSTNIDDLKVVTDSKVEELDIAVARHLGLDGGTLVSSDYIISPYIGGGYLNITNTSNNSRVVIDPNDLTGNGYIFQVHNGESISVGIDKNGSAYFSGEIVADSGSIANWDITTNAIRKIVNSDGGKIITGIQQPNHGSWAFFAGTFNGSNHDDCEFRVSHKGKLHASGADIDGKITASSGSITGNLSISGSITNTDGNYSVTLRGVQENANKGVFYITDNSSGTATYPFAVKSDGSFSATKARISGDSVFGGTLEAVSGSFTRLEAGGSSFTDSLVIIDAAGKSSVRIGTPDYQQSDGTAWEHITIRPITDKGVPIGNIGTPEYMWDLIYVRGGSVNASDRNKKKDIAVMSDAQEQLFNALIPVTYKFNDKDSHRTHYGFVSQDVEDAMANIGLTGEDFAGFCKDSFIDKDGNIVDSYGLRYTEFIALNTHMIQKVIEENRKLKERVDSLEKLLK